MHDDNNDSSLLPILPTASSHQLAAASQAASQAIAGSVFNDYRARIADATQRRQQADVQLFCKFLEAVGLAAPDLWNEPQAWSGIGWGLVEAFREWQLGQGYAIGSINVRLTSIRVYYKLAAKGGAVPVEQVAHVALVRGYRNTEGKRVDEKREQTRIEGSKRAEPHLISPADAALLKQQDDPRYALLMALLIDHGLRVSEVSRLTRKAFNLQSGIMEFFRPKVQKFQRHRMSADTLRAAQRFLAGHAGGQDDRIFPGVRAINERVRLLGLARNIDRLSPHDLRHYWATAASRNNTPIRNLQDAGGWSSPAMPLRYAQAQEIANEGVILE